MDQAKLDEVIRLCREVVAAHEKSDDTKHNPDCYLVAAPCLAEVVLLTLDVDLDADASVRG